MVAALQGKKAGPQNGPRWEDVRVFLALHRERTLARAAKSLGVDSSTLSRRLTALEETLGTRLFERTRAGLSPAEGTESLLAAAEEMARAHVRFSGDASGFERAAAGTVRLSAPPGMAEAFVAPSLRRLAQQHPDIVIELDVSMPLVDLTRREADLALRTHRPQAGDLISVKLGERRWIPVQGARAARGQAPLSAWGARPWVGWGSDMASFPPSRWMQRHVPRAAVVLRTSHLTSQAAAVREGVGVALMPPAFARRSGLVPLRYGRVLADAAGDLPVSETWLVGHAALRQVPRVAAVWQFLVREFARFEGIKTGPSAIKQLSD